MVFLMVAYSVLGVPIGTPGSRISRSIGRDAFKEYNMHHKLTFLYFGVVPNAYLLVGPW